MLFRSKKNESPTDKAARRTAVATIWMAIFTFILATTSGFTIWILKNQLREMREGGVDTRALADAAKVQAQAAKDMSDAAADQVDAANNFSDSAEEINHGVAGAVDQLKASADNTKTAIRNAQTAFRYEQRAWVGMSSEEVTSFEQSTPIGIKIVFFNSGRTPARNVKLCLLAVLSPTLILQPSADQIKMLQSGPFRQRASIAPQGTSTVYAGNPGAVGGFVSPEEHSFLQAVTGDYARIKSKDVIFYLFGELHYEDVSGQPHTTQFCVYLSDPDTKQMGVCYGFNELD